MAEVGVLNLTIKDNSEQAAAGLTKLADALSRVKAACGTAELNSYSDALKKLKSSIDNGANSYLTLGRLATSLNKVKAASEGFKLPDFRKLENLAKTLQENFNAESGLKRIAEGMEAIKTASEGFKMPDTKGLAKVMAAMNGTAGGDGKSSGTSGAQQMAEGFETVTSRIQQANDELLRFADTAESVQRLMSGAELPKLMAGIEAPKLMSAMETPQLMAGETAQRLLPGAEEAEQAGQEMTTALIAVMDNAIIPYPHFDKENAIPTEGSVTEEIEEATQAIIPYDEGMKSIISYAENLENRWDNIAAKMQEASVVAEKVAETVNTAAKPQRPEGWGTGSIRELYASSTGFGPALRGELGQEAKRAAVKNISEGTGLSLPEIHRQIRELGEAAADSRKRIQEMLASINSPNTTGANMSQGIDRMMGIGSTPKSAEDSASAFMTDAYKQVQQLMDMLNQPIKMNWSQAIDQLQGVNAQAKSAEDSMSAFLEGMRGDDEMAQKLRELNPELAEVADLGLNARDSLEEVERAEREAADSSGWLKTQIESLKKGFKNMGLTKLANQFLNIAKRMAIRAIIRQFTSGIKEGVQNVYFYSKAIGSSFAPSMDSAATALLQMKNSIGASLAPVIQSLIPYLVKVVNVFITLVNYANQFFSLLAGRSTWTEAVPYAAEAFENTENAARGATSAMKDLLADWDELNIIQSQGGSGGGGGNSGSGDDYTQMFREATEFSDKIRQLVEGIKEQFGSIWNLVGLIGIAILGWKVASGFEGFIATLGSLLAAGAIIVLSFMLTSMFDRNYLQTGDMTWVAADIVTTALSALLAAKVISKTLGPRAGLVAAALTLTVSAAADVIAVIGNVDTNALSTENLVLAIKGAMKTGFAAGLVSKFFGVSTLQAIGYGAGATLITLGVTVGVKALLGVAQTGEIDYKTWLSGLVTAVAGGIGATVIALTGGAGLAAALGIGVGFAAVLGLAFVAAVGITAMVNANKKNIKWGNKELTQQEIQNYVDSEEFFTINVGATINLAQSVVSPVSKEKRTEIETDLSAFFVDVNVVTLGLASEDTYKNMVNQLVGEDGQAGPDTILGKLKSFAEGNRTLIKTSLTLVPIVDKFGNVDKEATSEIMEKGISGWEEVEGYMFTLGSDLTEILTKGSVEGLSDFDVQMIKTLTEKMNNVSRAVLGSQLSSQAFGKMKFNLGDMSQRTTSEVLGAFKDYRNDLKTSFNDMLTEEYQSYMGLAAFYETRGEEGDAEKAQYWKDKARELEEHWDERLEAAVDEYSEPGRKLVRDTLSEKMLINLENLNVGMGGGFKDPETQMGIKNFSDLTWKVLFEGFEMDDAEYEKQFQEDVLDPILHAALGDENYKIAKEAIDAGAMTYADFFSNDAMEFIIAQAGGPELQQKWRDTWNSLVNKSIKPSSIELDESTKRAIDDMVGDLAGMIDESTAEIFKKHPVVAAESDLQENNTVTVPPVDSSQFVKSLDDMERATSDAVNRVMATLESVNGATFSINTIGNGFTTGIKIAIPQQRASGGFVRSGDLVMANENGNFEMMGKMGNQPVVANNQQIVTGISQGVAQANSGVESRLNTIESLLIRMLNKEFVAKAVPSSNWGAHNARSNEAYDKVTG